MAPVRLGLHLAPGSGIRDEAMMGQLWISRMWKAEKLETPAAGLPGFVIFIYPPLAGARPVSSPVSEVFPVCPVTTLRASGGTSPALIANRVRSAG
jgi:hypothetical protein